MAVSEKTVSALIAGQLPDFVRADHPKFQRFIELYYQWLETNNPEGVSNTAGNTVYHAMNIDQYRNIDETPDEFIRYFKQEILPYFPENTALSTEKILKSAREFYSKKGSEESLKWLFRALFNEDIEVLYPKEEILIASDGKWTKPKAFQITLGDSNKDVDVNLLEKRRIVGVDSGASCVVESANRTIDKTNGKEIIEIYVSNVKQYFNNGEKIRIDYIDENGVAKVFLERIIGTISNIKIDSNIKTDPQQRRRGLYYNIGDPVVVTGGLGITGDANDAVAIVGNVTLGSIESVTTKFPGYGYRLYSNTEVIVYRGLGDDPRANMFTDLQVSVLNQTACTSNSQKNFLIPITYDRSVIDYLGDSLISDSNYDPFTANNLNVILNVTESDKDDYYIQGEQIWANGTNFFDARFSGKVATPNNTIFGVGGPTNNTGQILIYDVRLQGVDSIATALSGSTLQTKNTDKVFIVNSVVNTQVPANGDSQLIQCLDFVTENTGGISLITVVNGGAGFRQSPRIGIESHYDSQLSSLYSYEDERELKRTHWQTYKDLGLIAHVRIMNGGQGYSIGDTVNFSGRGYGGAALVQSVGSGGRITSIQMTDRGEGYLARPEVHVSRNSPIYQTLSGTVNIERGSNLVIGTGTMFTGSSGANNRTLIRVNNEIRRVASVINNTHLYVNTDFKTTATGAIIEKQKGVEPVLIGYLFGDGVENIVNTTAIGRIRDLRLIYRGYDYVATPNVSLKILDTVINPIPESNVFTETEFVYQGNSILDATFKANVKSYNPSTGVLRLYDYSGAFSNTIDLISANGVYCNSNLSMNVPAPSQYPSQVIADGLPNPMRYGNGLAKGKAFFANGLIEFNGFYLNSDGFPSSDKVLEDGKIYHNFSYVIESEKNLVDYETTIKNIAHPAGMALIAKTISRNDVERTIGHYSNVTSILSRNRTEGVAAATVAVANSRSNVVTGTYTTWAPDPNNISVYANTRVNVGDLLIIDDDPDDIVVPEVGRLPITGLISKINSNTELEVYGDFVYRGQGLGSSNTMFIRILGTSNTSGNQVIANGNTQYANLVSNGSVTVTANSNTVVGNSTDFATFLLANDLISINNVSKTVVSITNNTSLVVNSIFSQNATSQNLIKMLKPERPTISTNTIIRINNDVREVISVTNGRHFIVNSNFTSNVTEKPLEILSNTRLVISGNANSLTEIVKAGDNVSLNIFTANVYTAQTGSVNVSTGSNTVLGVGTTFNANLSINDYIMVANQTRQVINISNATTLTVDTPYTTNANGVVYLKRATTQNARVNAVITNYIDINLAYYGNTTNAVYHVIPNLAGGGYKFKIVTLTGN